MSRLLNVKKVSSKGCFVDASNRCKRIKLHWPENDAPRRKHKGLGVGGGLKKNLGNERNQTASKLFCMLEIL